MGPAIVPLDSADGRAVVDALPPQAAEACSRMRSVWRRQKGMTTCGVRSLCMLLELAGNDARDELEVLGLSQTGRDMTAKVSRCGLTLPELVRLYTATPGVSSCDGLHCAPDGPIADVGEFREGLREALGSGRSVVINYHMSTLGQV
eukprot:TRINITY_DN12282_c0_g1_i1.p1 TRINITY_DN12282_c0_g1~~TRINITY_DN12282_c0_g1_i1.p1  ORF type:complete len:147 (+),score=29.74 TRINITY_DN12282_c0_g1_i1:80-520(+)